jgi:hypothetical protein
VLVGTGGGVSVGGGGTGVGVSVGGEGVGVSVGGGIGVGVGKLFDVPCSPSLPGGTTATLAGVGVKVGQGVRVGGASNSTGPPACHISAIRSQIWTINDTRRYPGGCIDRVRLPA